MPSSHPKGTVEVMRAFLAGQKRTKGSLSTDGATVWLHGNAIVRRAAGGYEFSLAGWNTPTTRRSVNTFLYVLGGYALGSVSQENFCAIYNGAQIHSNEWVRAENVRASRDQIIEHLVADR